MKRCAHLAAAAMLLTLGFARAEASPISFDDTFDPTDVFIKNNGGACTGNTATDSVTGVEHGGCNSLRYTHSLDGYVALTDPLASAWLTLNFYDDNGPGPDRTGIHTEWVNISLDGILSSNSPVSIINGSTAGSPFSPAFNVLAQLQIDGQLTVLLSRPARGDGNNDFYFASSQLIAAGERSDISTGSGTVSVPEPGTLGLLGVGLAAAATRRRRG